MKTSQEIVLQKMFYSIMEKPKSIGAKQDAAPGITSDHKNTISDAREMV